MARAIILVLAGGGLAISVAVCGCRRSAVEGAGRQDAAGRSAHYLAQLAGADEKARAQARAALVAIGPAALFEVCPYIALHLNDPDERPWRTACRVEEEIARRYQDDPRLDDYYASLRPARLPTKVVALPGGARMEFVRIPAGAFVQGSYNPGTGVLSATDMPCDYAPVRKVTISRPFWLARAEVSQEQWEAVMGFNGSRVKFPHYPIELVSWPEAMAFCRKLSDMRAPEVFDLPTEAQWEYACRAGGTSRHAFGNCRLLRTDWRLRPEGEWFENRWGLRHMHDGVFEWCKDWFEVYTEHPAVDPTGPATGLYRAIRSNYTYCSAAECRCTHRAGFPEDLARHGVGLRPICLARQE